MFAEREGEAGLVEKRSNEILQRGFCVDSKTIRRVKRRGLNELVGFLISEIGIANI